MDIKINKNLNMICGCGIALNSKKIKLVMVLPCEHIYHYKCIKNENKCKICNCYINNYFFMNNKLTTELDLQRYSDMLSVSNFCDMSDYSSINVLDNIINLLKIIGKIPFIEDIEDARQEINEFLSLNNTSIYIRGLDKIQKHNKVFIANHTSYLDFLLIMKFIDTYFLSSKFLVQNIIGRQFVKKVPIMIIDRDKSDNTVEQMKKFIKKHGSICIFPEGAISHPETIIKFRTGAFHIGCPIYAIVIRYENIKSDFSISKFLFKSCDRADVKIYLDVLGPYYPPFTDIDIEKIRIDMAITGKMLLSRVSNKDMKEKK